MKAYILNLYWQVLSYLYLRERDKRHLALVQVVSTAAWAQSERRQRAINAYLESQR